jgi:hypothetical protein
MSSAEEGTGLRVLDLHPVNPSGPAGSTAAEMKAAEVKERTPIATDNRNPALNVTTALPYEEAAAGARIGIGKQGSGFPIPNRPRGIRANRAFSPTRPHRPAPQR